jgi:hypothetical protein
MSDSFFQRHLGCRAAARHHRRCHHKLRSPKCQSVSPSKIVL